MGRINVLLDQLADNTDNDLRKETIRIGLETIDERRKDRFQEKELSIRRRVEHLNDSIDDLQMKVLMDNMGDSMRVGVEKVITKKQQEVKKLEDELALLNNK